MSEPAIPVPSDESSVGSPAREVDVPDGLEARDSHPTDLVLGIKREENAARVARKRTVGIEAVLADKRERWSWG